jgi:hypothetical protein
MSPVDITSLLCCRSGKSFGLNAEVIKPRRELILAVDAVDIYIYICTPQVLIEFTSNFDFNNMDQFIADMLLNWELYHLRNSFLLVVDSLGD